MTPRLKERYQKEVLPGLAKSLGRDTSDILACWVAELNKVHAYWSEA